MSAIEGTREANPDTAAGTILGTVHYMSPEQVEAREADKRSDIWALGAVLHEMTTGRRTFDGASAASVIGAILKDDPAPISASQPLAPPALDYLVERCLAKDPDERWQDAGDVKRQLSWIARTGVSGGIATSASVPSRPISRWIAVAGLLVGTTVGLGGLFWPRAPAGRQDRMVLSIAPPDGIRFGGSFAISPDGRRFAFVGQGSDGPATLWVRSIDSPAAQQLAGTEDAAYPFWSPQGDAIGFFASGKLKTTTLLGGIPKTLSTALNGRGGTWGEDGTILFVPESNGPVYRIPDKGGELVQATTLRRADRQLGHRWPVFVDRSRFIYTSQGPGDGVGIYLASLDSQDTVRLVSSYSNTAVANGRLSSCARACSWPNRSMRRVGE